jgi:hypothetical protein
VNVLTLNLASRPFRNNTVIGSVLATAVGVLVLATSANLYVFFTYRSSYARLQAEQRAERTRLQGLEVEERRLVREIEGRDFRTIYGRGKFAGELILRQSFSWTLLFNKLEELMPPEVMMASIRPNITGEGIVIRVDGVAKNQGAFLTLQERLLESPNFASVFPSSERRLNPARPEHSFTLNFDYLPDEPSAPEVIVASSDSPETGGAPVRPAGDALAQEKAAPSPAVTEPSPPPRSTQEQDRRDGDPLATVGRDGRSRTPEVLTRMMAAPGGIFVPDAAGTAAEPNDAAKRGGAPKPGKITPAADARDTEAQSPRSSRAERPGSPRPAAVTNDKAVKSAPASVPVNSAPKQRTAVPSAAKVAGPSRNAVRLDVPLRFESSPVRDVYASLERAHSVRLEIDPGVDGAALVTADLSGKQLANALVEVARAAGHGVTRRADGIYRVVTLSGGASITDKPIKEEDLPPEEVP